MSNSLKDQLLGLGFKAPKPEPRRTPDAKPGPPKPGNAPAHKLFELVRVRKTRDEADGPARSFADYEVSIDAAGLPDGVTMREIL